MNQLGIFSHIATQLIVSLLFALQYICLYQFHFLLKHLSAFLCIKKRKKSESFSNFSCTYSIQICYHLIQEFKSEFLQPLLCLYMENSCLLTNGNNNGIVYKHLKLGQYPTIDMQHIFQILHIVILDNEDIEKIGVLPYNMSRIFS